MKKITQIAFSVLFLLFSFNPIKLMSAQYVFKTDALHSDSVALYSFATKPDKYGTLVFNKVEGYLPNGTLVTINGGEDSIAKTVMNKTGAKGYLEDMLTITYEGKKYYVSPENLVLSVEDNPAETKDFINKKKNQHTYLGHWYNTSAPYLAILILLIVAILFALFVSGSDGLRMICVAGVPALLLLVVILEVMGIFSVGTNMLWWLDSKRYGGMTTVFRYLSFLAAVVMQISCMNIYVRGLAKSVKREEGDEKEPLRLNFMRPVYCAFIGAVVFVATILTFAFTGWNDNLGSWLALILFILITLFGIYSSSKQNIKVLGVKSGILFSVFAVIYAVGLVVALVMLIIGFFTAIFEMLITIVCCVILFFFLSKTIPITSYVSGDTIVEVFER
ncbi:MAG: hypothetical protein IKO62_09750 [Bacteroidales bacterium]|nr:hypothetical protein [Bacteroidota bacterium]MBR4536913.1 hypothetical protein [Bacteroidales bacterium]